MSRLKRPKKKKRGRAGSAPAEPSSPLLPPEGMSPEGAPLAVARGGAPEAACSPPVRGRERCPVVGIGASAGGLEALQEFFAYLGDATGMAYVVVQHLAPMHESLLGEILQRSTKMPVTEAAQGTPVQPDHVYVIPPNRELMIVRGVLRLAMRPEGGQRHLPIDRFLTSLAEECRTKAIGVVLSGTSTDGVLGAKAIKSAGGITFAQDEASAKYPEMPRNAATSGAVDFVMSPSAIAGELARLKDHSYVLLPPPPETETISTRDARHVEEILGIVRAACGTDFTHYKPSTVRRRILRRMALSHAERIEDYVALLKGNRAEVNALCEDMLITVTSFFRDAKPFLLLKRRVFPTLFRRPPEDRRVRIWAPGCSTGEEAYSIAITLFDWLGDRAHRVHVQVFGTDVVESAVDRARAGRYPDSIAADVPPDALQRYFVKTTDGWQVGKPLRDACVFAKHDLLRDPPFSRIDLVSCRNVLIYFGPILQKRALSLFHYALNPNGFLLLGAAEHVGASPELFDLIDQKQKLYAKKAVPARLRPSPEVGPLGFPAASSTRSHGVEARAADVQREADRILMSRYAPAGVVVDENLEILQFRGRTGDFLEARPGGASLNLLKMVREGLLLELRSAFQRARRDGVSVRRESIATKMDGKTVEVSLEVVPFRLRNAAARLFLVLFEKGPPLRPARAKSPPARAPRKGAKGRKGRTAEQELAATKEYLQTIIEEQEATNEELMSANEEILSSNEELQSTNEELETAKEELQSSNEELTTVNEELETRNQQLNEANGDLASLLASLQVPMVILDNDLRLNRASPAAERLLNLVPEDIGRRLSELRPNVDLPDLPRVVHEVVESMAPQEHRVRNREGRWHSMYVRPLKRRDHRIDGVVITWTEDEGRRGDAGREPAGGGSPGGPGAAGGE